MIRVTVEMVPQGDESRAYTLGGGIIANDGSGTQESGNYHASFGKTTRSGSRESVAKTVRSARVEGFPRKRLDVWHLINRALTEALA